MMKQFYLIQQFLVSMDLGVKVIKGYSSFPKTPNVEPDLPEILVPYVRLSLVRGGAVGPSGRDAVGIVYSPS